MKNKITILLIALIAVAVAGLVVLLNKLNKPEEYYGKYETSFAFVDLSTEGTTIVDYPIQLEIFIIYQAEKIINDVNNNVANRSGSFYSLLEEAENGATIGTIAHYGTDSQNYTVKIDHSKLGDGGAVKMETTFVNGKARNASGATHYLTIGAEEYYNSSVIEQFQITANKKIYGTAHLRLVGASKRTSVKVDSVIFTDYGVAIKNEMDLTRTFISNSRRSTALILAPSFYSDKEAIKVTSIAHSIEDIFDLAPFGY